MRYSLAAFLCLSSLSASANVLQYFAGISYSNPAELFKVKQSEFILGGTSFYVDAGFKGRQLNYNSFQYDEGVSHSRQTSLLPYGRIAKRIDSKMVVGVDVTEPYHSNLYWGKQAFTRYAATETLMTDVDISPRFSFSFTPKLYAGAGVNLNFLKNNETNWAMPYSQTQYANLVNRTSGFGTGLNAGMYYLLNATNFIGASYYGPINQRTRGESIFNGQVNNALTFNFHMPATTIINYVHLFNPTWLLSLQAFRSEWNINQYARISYTASPAPLPENFVFAMKYKTSMAYNAAVRHQYNEKTGLTLLGVIDNGPERESLRTINFPSDTQYLIGLLTDYHLNKTTSLELLYGHVFSKTTIQNTTMINGQSAPFTTGRVTINADVVDLKIKIQV